MRAAPGGVGLFSLFEKSIEYKSLPKSARVAYSSAMQRAKRRKLEMLSRQEFVELWNRAGGKCELSGIRFSDTPESGVASPDYKRKGSFPWQPSIDQVYPGVGYQATNCQLVCKAVNIGKNSYQPETFEKWVVAVAAQLRQSTRSIENFD